MFSRNRPTKKDYKFPDTFEEQKARTDEADALRQRGNALFKKGELTEAAKLYEQATLKFADWYADCFAEPAERAMVMAVKTPAHLNLALCSWYQQESQNVKAKNYCSVNTENNAADCAANGGQWLEQPAFGIPPPECVVAPYQRDNHLGDGPTGQEVSFNWTIPTAWGLNGADDVSNCVARFRYNITTSDTRVCSDSTIDTQTACEAAGLIWSAAYLDSSYNDLVNGNNNAANGNQNPPLLEGNPDVDMDGFLSIDEFHKLVRAESAALSAQGVSLVDPSDADADAAFTDEQIDEIFRHLNVDAGAGLSVVELSFIGLLTKTDSETSGGV